jgi:ATP-dependent Lhr-like helicase
MLRETRRQPAAGAMLSLSGADPLNLVGILTPGPRLPALTGNRLLYRDGLPIALLAAGEVQFLETLDAASEWDAHKALLRCAEPASSIVSDPQLRGRDGIAFRAHQRSARPS